MCIRDRHVPAFGLTTLLIVNWALAVAWSSFEVSVPQSGKTTLWLLISEICRVGTGNGLTMVATFPTSAKNYTTCLCHRVNASLQKIPQFCEATLEVVDATNFVHHRCGIQCDFGFVGKIVAVTL